MSTSFSFVIATVITLFLVFITVTIHYEVLRLISEIIPKLKMQPRVRILVVIYGAFFAHTVEVLVFTCAYYGLTTHLSIGGFHGVQNSDFFGFFYYSTVVYTSLGFGDILPQGNMRLLAGAEGLLGLLMIGWSASFTYLMMEKLWLDHRKPPKK